MTKGPFWKRWSVWDYLLTYGLIAFVASAVIIPIAYVSRMLYAYAVYEVILIASGILSVTVSTWKYPELIRPSIWSFTFTAIGAYLWAFVDEGVVGGISMFIGFWVWLRVALQYANKALGFEDE